MEELGPKPGEPEGVGAALLLGSNPCVRQGKSQDLALVARVGGQHQQGSFPFGFSP